MRKHLFKDQQLSYPVELETITCFAFMRELQSCPSRSLRKRKIAKRSGSGCRIGKYTSVLRPVDTIEDMFARGSS